MTPEGVRREAPNARQGWRAGLRIQGRYTRFGSTPPPLTEVRIRADPDCTLTQSYFWYG